MMSNEEDKGFLPTQKKPGGREKIGSVDTLLTEERKEANKATLGQKEES